MRQDMMDETHMGAGGINNESNYIVDCTGRRIKVISTLEEAHKAHEKRIRVSSGMWSDIDDPWDA